MKHVSLDEQPEAVTKFVLSLIANPNGSALELNGHVVACVAPPKLENGDSAPDGWTAAKHIRRAELIKRKYSGGLTPAEVAELATLQELLVKYRQQVAHRFLGASAAAASTVAVAGLGNQIHQMTLADVSARR